MSGPKCPAYTVTEQQRRRIEEEQRRAREKALEQQRIAREQELKRQREEEERRLEQQRLQAETKRRGIILDGISKGVASLSGHLPRIEQLIRESGQPSQAAEQIKQRLADVKAELEKLKQRTPGTSSGMQALNGELQNVMKTVSEAAQSAGALSASLGEAYRQELREIIEEGMAVSFEGIGAAKETGAQQDDAAEQLARIHEALSGIASCVPMPLQGDMQRIRQLVEEKAELGGETLKGIRATVVAPFVQRCRDCSGYDDVLAEYRLLAEEAGVPAERFACTREDTGKMKQAVETLKAVLLRRREREYIHEKLDEAIRELGYELVGDGQTGRDGHHKLHELYLFTEGTVIETIVDEQGKITMQLCGVGTTDREPTAAEARELVRIMDGDFCTFFRGRLVEKLAEYGIEMPSFSRAPATGDVAQIINANDYHLSRPLNSFRVDNRADAAGDRRVRRMGEEE